MEIIMEHYGSSLLQLLGGVSILALIGTFLQSGGNVQMWVVQYLQGIAG